MTDFYDITLGDSWINSTNWNSYRSVCDWYGIVCNEDDGRLFRINLAENDIQGAIPTFLSQLIDLRQIRFGKNKLTGAVPSEIGLLESLRHIGFTKNDMTGPVPSELGRLENLGALVLDHNGFTGTIPSELGLLKILKEFFLHKTKVTGTMPAEVCALTDQEGDFDFQISSDMNFDCSCCTLWVPPNTT